MPDYSKNPMTGTTVSARLSRWLRDQTSARHRQRFLQGALGAACFGAFVAAMPMIAGANAVQQSDEQFRDRSVQLAEIREDEVEVTSALTHKSQLLSHDWLRFVEYSLERDPSSALSPYAAFDRDKAAINSLVTLEVPKRTDAEYMLQQRECLATAIYYEARSESVKGQLGVAEVIINRVNDHRYPNSVCDVVYQGATRTTGCQFTFTCDGAMNKAPRGQKWEKANTIAAHVMMDLNERKTAGATHYHATYVNPVWNSGLIRTKKIGTHIFYRFPRGSEWSVASARQSARLAQRRAGLRAITPATSGVEAQTEILKPETVADLNAQSLQTIQSAVAVETSADLASEAETAEAAITSAAVETSAAPSANSAL
jgi:spore germination cell wall hydrolase CwlJ-like protein